MVYNFESFIYDNLQKYIVKAINSRKITLTVGENLLLQNLIKHNTKLNVKALQGLFKEKHEDLNSSYRGLKNKLIDVAKLSKIKDETGISISIKIYDLVRVSKIEKNTTRKKFNRSTGKEKDDKYFNFDNFNYPKKFKHFKLVKVYPNFANYRDTRTKCLTSFKKQDLINY
ncbi:MAG: hypothetical protein KIC54_01260 [Clostridium sp.]|nr:hypothetical protein [Clostridium sp.]